jgi:large repetitive protein
MRISRLVLLFSLVALVVTPVALALRFTDEAYHPPIGETGKPFSWSFTGAGGCGPALPYQYRVLGGTVPPGLTLDSSGLVHGTPTQTGDYSFWVELSDENPPSAAWCRPSTAQREFTITIVEGLKIAQTQSALKPAILNQPYNMQFTASGGGTQSWSIAPGFGTGLPAGLSLDSSTGLLSGTATTTGTYTFKVKVTDQTRTDIQTYNLSVIEHALAITKTVPAAEVGLPFTLTPSASGGVGGNHTWSLSGTLPAGLTFNAVTGTISGTPTVAGASPLKLVVTDPAGLQATADVNLVVVPHLSLLKKLLAQAKVGKHYSARLNANGGVRPRFWTILGVRSLPAGLKLDKRRGLITGTPTQVGTFGFRVQVADKLGAHSSVRFTLKVGK